MALKDRPEIRIVDGTLKSPQLEETARKADYYPDVFRKRRGRLFPEPIRTARHELVRHFRHERQPLLRAAPRRPRSRGSGRSRTRSSSSVPNSWTTSSWRYRAYVLDLNNARERIQVNRGAADQAQENLRINRVRYDAGEGIATEVLDAVTLLTTAENQLHPRDLRLSPLGGRNVLCHRKRPAGGIQAMKATENRASRKGPSKRTDNRTDRAGSLRGRSPFRLQGLCREPTFPLTTPSWTAGFILSPPRSAGPSRPCAWRTTSS